MNMALYRARRILPLFHLAVFLLYLLSVVSEKDYAIDFVGISLGFVGISLGFVGLYAILSIVRSYTTDQVALDLAIECAIRAGVVQSEHARNVVTQIVAAWTGRGRSTSPFFDEHPVAENVIGIYLHAECDTERAFLNRKLLF